MWLTLAFTSAALLGFYDAAKKKALTGNAVLPVLLLNTLFSTLIFLPAILSAEFGLGWFDHTVLATAPGSWEAHRLVILKSCIVLTSWIFGYFGMKHLPITIVGPINATRPVMVLVGALLMAVLSVPLNYFVVYPAYVVCYHLPLEAIIGMYQAIRPSTNGLLECLMVFNMPFTFVKGMIDVALCFLIYKPLSPLLHK